MDEAGTAPRRAVRGVVPYIGLDGRAAAAADFYVRAFGARVVVRIPSDEDREHLMHCEVEIHGGSVMLTDMRPPGDPPKAPQGFHLQLVVDDGDLWWDRAVDAGCTEIMPFQKMVWGDRWGLLADPFGLVWAIDEPAG
jgi:PhnB protein